MTSRDYLALPDDGNRYELIHGELTMSPSADYTHGLVVSLLIERLRRFAVRGDLGDVSTETDMILGRHHVCRPDITFIGRNRGPIVKKHIIGPPDLVVEVTSPDNWRIDVYEKRDLYEKFGVREYWVIDIADGRNRVFQWVLRRGQFAGGLLDQKILQSYQMKGFKLRLSEIWRLGA
jgi:Uma2 family endonuclease